MEVAGDRYFTVMWGGFFLVLVIVHGGEKKTDLEGGRL